MPKVTAEIKQKILKDILEGKIDYKDIAIKYGISPTYVTVIKHREIGKTDEFDSLIKKGSNYKIRVTSYVRGSLKNKFIKDCLDKGFKESQMAHHIFETYYFIQDSIHNFDKIQPNKIKEYLKARIKL